MTQSNGPTGSPPPPPPPSGRRAAFRKRMRGTWRALAHYLNFTLLGPLIIYLIKKGQNAFLDTEAKEALNFSADVPDWTRHYLRGALRSDTVFLLPFVAGQPGDFYHPDCFRDSGRKNWPGRGRHINIRLI